eukprot:TRINITY_DN11921_c0_g1_i2.p1 TRINITY_DN11921_c0_g1~~TRINITY_DN11921_c0_g1_i2.p1  ORF type:complete len:181 (+),score=28.36 TRINITY_DN11921_c0_g1_i2:438-980(+)
MQRMGIPSNSVLSIEKWADTHNKPMDLVEQDTLHSLADRIHSFEMVEDMAKDPSEHDTHAKIEDGDNRLTERMLLELMTLKLEGKLDHNTAGAELERHPEILRRVTSCIAICPPSINADSCFDDETTYHMSLTGKKNDQTYVKQFGTKRIFRDPIEYYHPENIPANGFRPPSASQRSGGN